MSKEYDAIVVGAGPAGISAANLLAGKGLETLLVDRSTQQQLQLPETFYGISRHLLARLGIEKDISTALEAPKSVRLISTSDNFTYQIGIESKDGTNGHYGMNLNRAILEQILIECAVKRGATYLPAPIVEDFIFADDRLIGVKCRTPDGYVEFSAKAVIDARGKKTQLSRRLGSSIEREQQHKHVAVFAQFNEASLDEVIPDNRIVAIALDNGYVLAMPLPNGTVSIMAAIERQKASHDISNLDKIFQEAIDCWKPLAKAIQAAEKVTPTLPVMNLDWQYERFSGNRFLVLGDAVAFLDPFSCNGVAIGINGGEIAADFIIQALSKSEGWLSAEQLSSYDRQLHSLIDKWKRVWGIENLSLSSMGLLKQSLGLLDQLQFLKLGAINESWKQNNPAMVAKP